MGCDVTLEAHGFEPMSSLDFSALSKCKQTNLKKKKKAAMFDFRSVHSRNNITNIQTLYLEYCVIFLGKYSI